MGLDLATHESHQYVHDLEEQLGLLLFGPADATDAQAAVLLVRGAMADGDGCRATRLAQSAQELAGTKPGDSELAAAADHARGLAEEDPATLERAAGTYSAPLARARATEEAGLAWAARSHQETAISLLRRAYTLYEQLGADDGMARVRAQLRAAGVRLHYWKHANRPAFGWGSLTDAERRIADLVAQGLSNREVASQVFLSTHTVAFHLRHIYWKLNVSSRVQLARLAAELARAESA